MARIVLVTGGCRSGKSAYAQQLAESLPPSRLFVATCPVTDDEMRRRIEQHRQSRRDRGWETVEEQLDLAGVFRRHAENNVLLVDCVTLWINNLMHQAGLQSHELAESDAVERCELMIEAADACRGTVIFVTNEVGLGVVPENALARSYRDLIGRANQTIAARADAVTLVCCGIPLHLKERMAW
jgi:adenosylcobinamide kinase / adenosylcobinamide-phosphate guanylyltransferase